MSINVLKIVGVIYKITNSKNGKIYIGQTLCFEEKEQDGAIKRLKEHFRDVKTGKFSCPALDSAIKKYGEKNFTTEVIDICPKEEIDNCEVRCIEHFDSTNKTIGYNLSKGGKGVTYSHTEDRIREKISSRKRKNSDAEMNILDVNKNNKLIGYKVRRKISGKEFTKWFTSSTYTPEENLEKCRKWLSKIKKDTINLDDLETKETHLPKNITFLKENEKILGYRVNIMKNGKKYDRSFQDSSFTMEEKMTQCMEFINSIKNGNPLVKSTANFKHDNIPKNVQIEKNRKGEIIGYSGKIIINKKVHRSLFIKLGESMDEKLKKASEFIEAIKKEHNLL